jgi:hemerythrin-like metal-binding protein
MSSMTSKPITISVFDDNKLLSQSISLLLQRLLPDALVLQTDNLNDLEFSTGKVNLILFLLSPPYLENMRKLLELSHKLRSIPVIVVHCCEDELLDSTLRSADFIKGFVHLQSSVEEFAIEIDSVLNDRSALPKPDPDVKRGLAGLLTSRQLETFFLLCQGKTNKEIASIMGVSDNTIRTYVSIIFNMLGVRNRTEAANLGKNIFDDSGKRDQLEYLNPHVADLMDIDTQHRNLDTLLNQLANAIDERSSMRIVTSILHKLIQNAKFHFMTEEQLMSQFHYPEEKAHREEHVTLLRGMRSIKKKLKSGDGPMALPMIGQSMIAHTKEADNRLENFIMVSK